MYFTDIKFEAPAADQSGPPTLRAGTPQIRPAP